MWQKAMQFELITELDCGLKLLSSPIFQDKRGKFFEGFRINELAKFGINETFLQDNFSYSKKNVLRGMHFQWDMPQGKLIRVLKGAAKIVEIDVRKNSPWLGKWFAFDLNEENNYCLWIPAGFANGFLSLTDELLVFYKCTEYYNPKGEGAILWNDSEIGVDWGIDFEPILSDKDKNAMRFEEWLNSKYFDILAYTNTK